MVFSTEILCTAGQQLFLARHVTLSLNLGWPLQQALLALTAGVCVLIRPKNLNLILAAYLILLGVLGIVQIYL